MSVKSVSIWPSSLPYTDMKDGYAVDITDEICTGMLGLWPKVLDRRLSGERLNEGVDGELNGRGIGP